MIKSNFIEIIWGSYMYEKFQSVVRREVVTVREIGNPQTRALGRMSDCTSSAK